MSIEDLFGLVDVNTFLYKLVSLEKFDLGQK